MNGEPQAACGSLSFVIPRKSKFQGSDGLGSDFLWSEGLAFDLD